MTAQLARPGHSSDSNGIDHASHLGPAQIPLPTAPEGNIMPLKGSCHTEQPTVFRQVNHSDVRRSQVLSHSVSPTSPGMVQLHAATPVENSLLTQATRSSSENGSGHNRSSGSTEGHETRAGTPHIDDDSTSAAPTPHARPSRQCKDVSLKRIRSAVQDCSPDEEEEDDNGIPKSERKAARRDAEFKVASHHVIDKAFTETRQKGPCSYEQCPNPYHSSGGGFKVVTGETKAGNRDWSPYNGRVFCNACFTQYATRGTFQRPGRTNPLPQPTNLHHHIAPVVHHAVHHPVHHHPVVHHPVVETHDTYRSRPASVSPYLMPEIPTIIEDGMEGQDEACGVLMLELVTDGRNVQYQWLRDGRPIPGANAATLVIKNPKQCVGDFSCKVRNEYGQAPTFPPVHLPISLSDAKERYMSKTSSPSSSLYKLTCVCGRARTGTPSELVEPCECGLEVCGTVEPIEDAAHYDR